MMTKEKHIEYWKKSTEDDCLTIYSLFKDKRFVHSLFFCHLCLEKLIKCAWVQANNENSPPRTYNLIRILSETNLKMDDQQSEFLRSMNDFQIDGRYPDYLFQIHKRCNLELTTKILKDFEHIKTWIQNQLP